MRRLQLFALILVSMLVFSGPGAAQIAQAPRPAWSPGLYWRYANDADAESLEYWVLGVRSIRDVDHYVLAQRTVSDVSSVSDGTSLSLAFAPVRSPFPRRTNTPDSQTYLDFPLEVGIAWSVRQAASAGFLSASAIDAQLDALERVETGFGAYHAFRVTYTRDDDTWDLWYSPAIQSWIKQTSPVDGSAFVLQESWQFTQAYALDAFYDFIEVSLTADRLDARRLLNDLIQFEFDAPRAETLKAQL